MAKVKHGVVRTDLMSGTDDRSAMADVRYMSGGALADIDNGSIVYVKDVLIAGERQIFEAGDMAADTAFEDLAVVASPEVMYDEREDTLIDFYNMVDGFPQRVYRFRHKNIFSVTKECLDGIATPAVGNYVDRQAGNKGLVVAAKTAATFGRIIRIDTIGRDSTGVTTFYTIQLV